jgi:hypothetical protein
MRPARRHDAQTNGAKTAGGRLDCDAFSGQSRPDTEQISMKRIQNRAPQIFKR